MRPAPKLVYDIGMHKAEDTLFYLKKGYKVVAVEANPALAAEAVKRLKPYIDQQQLVILNVGIAPQEGSMVFYRNDHELEWSSFDKVIGTRNGTPYTEITVPCQTAQTILTQYGRPHYIKIDIEGYDAHFIRGIVDDQYLPPYMSCEASSLDCLDALVEKGYSQFKLINQARNFEAFSLTKEQNVFGNYLQHWRNRFKLRWQKIFPVQYQHGSSGPFGEEASGPWCSAADIKAAYLAFYALPDQQPINQLSWFDIHAKRHG